MNPTDRPTAVNPEQHVDPIPADEDTLLGTTLHDTYKVLRFMAEGGMGRVYEAQHTRIAAKRFAIKVLHGELKNSLEVRMRFRREAEAAATVTHPHVVGVHDFGYAPDGRPYLVCDYLEGTDLGTLLVSERPLSIALAVQIARQLCRALEAAHQRNVIHRDLKPANVFLVGNPQDPDVRVLDFGLSRVVEGAEASVTQTGMVMGTPAFMSPEQAKGERADHRVDIYGVGAVLYSTLTGKPPFDEETPHQTVLAVMSSEPTRPRALVPTIPPELELIVQKAMARSPDERYASMSELDSALARFEEGFVKRVGARTLSEPPPSIPPRPGSAVDIASELDEARGIRRRAIAWMGLGAALLVVGGLSAAFGVLAELAPNRALLPSELLLATLAVLGSVFTPSLLFLGWLRRSYWNNSARMVGFVTAVRAPVLAGVAVYGIAALLGRGVDALWPHLDASAATPNMSGWVGWAPFLFGAALVAAGGAALRLRLTAHSASLLKRFAGGPVLVAAVSTACAAILISGYEARDPTAATTTASGAPITAEAPAALPLATATPGAAAPPTPVTADPTPSQAASAVSPPPEKDAAPQTDLDVAIAGGVEGLMELRGRYPKDPKVLKPLALELAKSPEQTSELLRVLDVLFAEAPKEVEDRELGRMLYRAALSPTTSQRALELMRTRLGPTGADMLFDIVLNNQELRGRARSALETADVQRNLSPPLKIAYDLYFASTCSARVDLLPQAIKDGDERAIFVLTLFSVKPKSACPKKKPCYAPCGKEAPAMEDAIKQIRARLLASVPKP